MAFQKRGEGQPSQKKWVRESWGWDPLPSPPPVGKTLQKESKISEKRKAKKKKEKVQMDLKIKEINRQIVKPIVSLAPKKAHFWA